MHEYWNLEGFQIHSESDLLCLPVFVKKEGDVSRYYAQFTFSDLSDYFELTEISIGKTPIRKLRRPADPERNLYYGLIINGNFELVEKSGVENALSKLDTSKLSPSAQLQYAELARSRHSLPSISRIKGTDDDPSFWATLSAQAFIDSAITKISNSAQRHGAVRDILWCSRWVTDWKIDRVPADYIKRMLDDLTVSASELQRELSAEEQIQTAAQSSEGIQTGEVSLGLENIANLKRQELRLSRLLKMILDDPRNGRAIAMQYVPKTKYETIVLPFIQQAAAQNIESDSTEQEIRVAQLISKIFVKYFPIRRGRFLVDFLRNLSDYPIVKGQLANIYDQKKRTYGVSMYELSIRELLK